MKRKCEHVNDAHDVYYYLYEMAKKGMGMWCNDGT